MKKVLSGNDTDANKEFTFKVTLTDKDDQPIANETFGNYRTDANGVATIVLKGGETGTLVDLPNGTKYSVAENDYIADGYTLSWTGNTSGTITGASPKSKVTLTATNTRNTFGNLVVEKILEGTGYSLDDEFIFTITLDDKTVNDIYGGMEFKDGVAVVTLKGSESAKAEGLPNGIKYEVVEDDYRDKGYVVKYDENKSGAIKGNDEIKTVVTNTRNIGQLTVNKVVSGNDVNLDDEFSFKVILSDKTINGTYGEMEFIDGVAEFTLKANEAKTANDILAGVEYTVNETDSKGYTVSHTGNTGTLSEKEFSVVTFTNTRDAGKTSYGVEKIWDDGNNQDKIRPNQIEVVLLADGIEYGKTYLNNSNNWKYEWKDLPAKKDGKDIIYVVREIEEIDGYKTTYEYDDNHTYITNSHTPKPGPTPGPSPSPEPTPKPVTPTYVVPKTGIE